MRIPKSAARQRMKALVREIAGEERDAPKAPPALSLRSLSLAAVITNIADSNRPAVAAQFEEIDGGLQPRLALAQFLLGPAALSLLLNGFGGLESSDEIACHGTPLIADGEKRFVPTP